MQELIDDSFNAIFSCTNMSQFATAFMLFTRMNTHTATTTACSTDMQSTPVCRKFPNQPSRIFIPVNPLTCTSLTYPTRTHDPLALTSSLVYPRNASFRIVFHITPTSLHIGILHPRFDRLDPMGRCIHIGIKSQQQYIRSFRNAT